MNAAKSDGEPVGNRSSASAAVDDFLILNEEMAALCRAGLPLEGHLRRLGGELPGRAGPLAERIGRRIESGETLASAMEAECASLPAAYRAVITAGVESGQLARGLEAIVDSTTRLAELRQVTVLALVYPLVIAVVTCVLLAGVITLVVPTFGWLDNSYYAPLAPLSEWPLLVPTLALVVPGFLVISMAVWWWRSGRVSGSQGLEALPLAWIPGTKVVRRWSHASTFAEILSLLIDRRVPLAVSLRLAADATADRSLRADAQRLAEDIERGSSATSVIMENPSRRKSGIPVLVRLALQRRSDTAGMARSLRQAAAMYRERAIQAAQWYAEYAPILLVVSIGGTITVGFTLLVIWPYAGMLHELSGWNWK